MPAAPAHGRVAVTSGSAADIPAADDTCYWANDGMCEATGDVLMDLCAMGTDCTDCGGCGAAVSGASGVTNVALGKAVTSSTLEDASTLVDGDDSTGLSVEVDAGAQPYVTIDLGNAHLLSAVTIWHDRNALCSLPADASPTRRRGAAVCRYEDDGICDVRLRQLYPLLPITTG